MNASRTALVTGASRGIGRGVALALAGIGYDVVVNYASNAEAARAVGDQIEALGRNAHLVQADISVGPDRQRLVDEAFRRFGQVDLLVNNAGVSPRTRSDLLDASEQSFDHMIDVNLKGPYFLTRAVARSMIENLGDSVSAPKIVVISSISAYTASTNRGDYCIAKAGLSMLVSLFAARLAEHGINVYEIRPGIIATDMTGPVFARYDSLIHDQGLTPIRRWGQPEDVSRAVVAIAQDLLPFSTGSVIDVDGGFHLRTL